MAQSNTLYSRLPEGYHSWLQQRLYGHPFLTLSDVEKQMRLESGGNPTAKSNQGAMGLFQQLPGTFASMGVGNDINDPYQNTEAYLKYMEEGYNKEGSKEGAYGHYFAGPDHKQWGPKTAAYQQHMMGGEPMSGGEMMAQGMNSLQEMPDGQEYMAGALTLDQMNTEQGVNDIIDSVMGNRDPMQAMFAGMANAKHTPYAGGLQSLSDMMSGGARAAQVYERDTDKMKLQMDTMRLGLYGRQADREQRKAFHDEDLAARERATNKQRNPWMKVDGGLYNWETDSYKEIGEADLKDKYMKVGDGLFNLETESFESLPDDGTRPEWLPQHFEDVKDYNQISKSINEEARKDTKNFGIKREYFNSTRAIVENNPDFNNYSVAEAGALVKNLEKMLDPAGAVLAAESEAYQAGAAYLKQAQKLVSQAQKGGTTLTEGQIQGIVDTTNTLYKAMQDDVTKVTERYGRRYERQGILEDSRYQFLPMLPGIGEEVETPDVPLPPFDPTAHGLTPIINKNRSNP